MRVSSVFCGLLPTRCPSPVLSQAKLEGTPPPFSLAEKLRLMLRQEGGGDGDAETGGGGDLGLSLATG